MTDIVSAETRSRMMAGIRSRDTAPERAIRSGLHRMGFRFRICSSKVMGRPDLVLARYRAVVFIHGCFWHGHDCALFKMPGDNRAFWQKKIDANRRRDADVRRQLTREGWRVLTIWECAIRGPGRMPVEQILRRTAGWILSDHKSLTIRGRKQP